MKKDTYHHGNLRVELIEKGLEYIDKHGVETLSMRKLADSIGVSSAAPYAHFKNKDAFLCAVRDYINEQLYNNQMNALQKNKDSNKILLELGKSYILFFYNNPLYYQFLFSNDDEDVSTNPSFAMFKQEVLKVLNSLDGGKTDEETLRAKTLALWSMVHGLAQLVTLNGVVDKKNLEKEIEAILNSVKV